MQTQFKRRPSSVEALRRNSFDTRQTDHPAQELIQRLSGSYRLDISVEEDTATLALFKHVPGLIAFLCTIKKEGKIVGQGRGSSTLNRYNKYIERTVRSAFNSSLIDAMVRSTKVLDTLADPAMAEGGADIQMKPRSENEPITAKQRQYLLELIQTRVSKEDREQWFAQLDQLTKDEASLAIQQFTK